MKPFDLQKALAGEPVVTRNGDKVIELKHYTSAHQDDYCISGIIISYNSSFVETFLINGQLVKNMTSCGNDLLMAEPETWINVYYSKIQDKIWNSVKYNSEEEAKENIVTTNSSYLTTVQIL